ncbi:hypothetical protein [Neorhizobium alkalisoli]|uniref:Secreted protein n=1 Tax=Neorhizobium alkalisoli TaxID=528178 RepID=A0A561R3B0_9HYPH|nr:hypothetical protein [Neorhizobium alkalisoli]TWF57094.1 hypothetical protein FHW37_102734 [Neorhizobium alkalisoli]
MKRVSLAAVLIQLLAATASIAQDVQSEAPTEITLDDGISFTLPAGWVVANRRDTRRGDKGQLSVNLVCESARCQKTQETCHFRMPAQRSGTQGGDAASLAALYADPLDRYFRLRAVRNATSKDAEFRKMLGPMTIGTRDWQVVETDARHNMKSGLFAQTFIDGFEILAICKTCETGEIRHQGAMEMMKSFRRDED